jgi:tRNA pseudouridine38-40 synthase
MPLRNIKLVLSYDGTDFCGWQVQPGLPTIQGVLSEAIGKITGEAIVPQSSGRTDSGVHALAQVAHFATTSSIPSGNIRKALNSCLPDSIRILSAEEAPVDFHARRSATAKTYRYRLYSGEICPPFLVKYVTHNFHPLDFDAMAKAAALIVGEHDFTSFAAVDPERRAQDDDTGPPSNIRTVFSSTWEAHDNELIYTVRGNGFLHHMVRNLVGTFLLVGKGSIPPEELLSILEKKSRSAAGPTAPPQGLYLVSVEY